MNATEARKASLSNLDHLAKKQTEDVVEELSKSIKNRTSEGYLSAECNVSTESAIVRKGWTDLVIEHFENQGFAVSYYERSLYRTATFTVFWNE